MKQWKILLKVLRAAISPIDPKVELEYQRPVGDESGSVDVKLDPDTDVDAVLGALKKVEPDWGWQTDGETNSKDATFRINLENDFKASQLK